MKVVVLVGLVWFACWVHAYPIPSPSAVDVTDRMENLGSPLKAYYPDSFRKGSGAYARNIWTMGVFAVCDCRCGDEDGAKLCGILSRR